MNIEHLPNAILVGIEYAGEWRDKAPMVHRLLDDPDAVDILRNFDAPRIDAERTLVVQYWGGKARIVMHMNRGESLFDAVEQAAAELADPVDPPAFDTADEEALARAAMPVILSKLS